MEAEAGLNHHGTGRELCLYFGGLEPTLGGAYCGCLLVSAELFELDDMISLVPLSQSCCCSSFFLTLRLNQSPIAPLLTWLKLQAINVTLSTKASLERDVVERRRAASGEGTWRRSRKCIEEVLFLRRPSSFSVKGFYLHNKQLVSRHIKQ